jgi:hypothetical protein
MFRFESATRNHGGYAWTNKFRDRGIAVRRDALKGLVIHIHISIIWVICAVDEPLHVESEINHDGLNLFPVW